MHSLKTACAVLATVLMGAPPVLFLIAMLGCESPTPSRAQAEKHRAYYTVEEIPVRTTYSATLRCSNCGSTAIHFVPRGTTVLEYCEDAKCPYCGVAKLWYPTPTDHSQIWGSSHHSQIWGSSQIPGLRAGADFKSGQ